MSAKPLTDEEVKALDTESPAAEAMPLEWHHWDLPDETNVTLHGRRVIARTPQKYECEEMMVRLVDLRNAWPRIRARIDADRARIAELEAENTLLKEYARHTQGTGPRVRADTEARIAELTAELAALSKAAMDADLHCWGPAWTSPENAAPYADRLRRLAQPNRDRSNAAWRLLDRLRVLSEAAEAASNAPELLRAGDFANVSWDAEQKANDIADRIDDALAKLDALEPTKEKTEAEDG